MTEAAQTNGYFSLPPGCDFARSFASGFHARFAAIPPEVTARTLILANSGRTQRLIEEALADSAPRPGPLPRIVSISQLNVDPALAPDQPSAISPLRRQLRLTRLVEAYLKFRAAAGEMVAPVSAAADLAQSLALLLDQMHDEGIAPADLETAISEGDLAGEAAAHWQQNLAFIDIVRQSWPEMLSQGEGGRLDPRARQRDVVDDLIRGWADSPTDAPIIAAGSTGSVGSTAELLQAIAALPQGSVVLPGFDPQLDPEIWKVADADHPMGPFRRWMGEAGLQPSDVRPWHDTSQAPRVGLIAQALRPAPVTDHWHAAAAALRKTVEPASADMCLIEADSARLEACAIAIAMREAIEVPDQRVTLITPDAALARRVTAQLVRFGIVPDDTSGQPLAQTPPGILMSLIQLAASGRADAVQWAALISHPLMRPAMDRASHLRLAHLYERKVLRETHLPSGLVQLPPWPEKEIERDPAVVAWLDGINKIIAALTQVLGSNASLHDILNAHVAAAEAFTTDGEEDHSPGIWNGEAGAQLKAFVDRLTDNADAYDGGAVEDYPALMRGLLRGETLRPRPRQPHPRVAIRGPREARIEAANVVILAGLNEGIWPAPADPGPWLSRPMYEKLGLSPPERTVGLSAHDFQQGICMPRVILSRARKIDGAPTVASRWLIRLQTLITGIGEEDAWKAMRNRGAQYLKLAVQISRPDAPVERATRPVPVLSAIPEPRRLSVTEIETLIRDAYSVFASRVLKLRPMNPLGRTADARERGTVVHRIMEQFILATKDWPGIGPAREIMLSVADEVLACEVEQPDLRRVWRARVERFADWFIRLEDQRRASGATPFTPEVRGTLEIDLPNGPLEIRAKADRIDWLPDGSAAIYDYKTGAPPSEKQIGKYSQQLHLQAAILAQDGFEGIPPLTASEGAYIGLTGNRDGGKQTGTDDLQGELPEVLNRLHALLSAYDTGAPWTALGRPERQVFESDYDHLSRRDEWSGEADT